MKTGTKIITVLVLTGLLVGFIYIRVQIAKLKDYCVKLKGFRFTNASLTDVGINFKLFFKNKSKLEIQLASYDFDLLINNIKVGRLNNSLMQTIAPQATSEINFNLSFNPKKFFNVGDALTFINNTMFDKSKIMIQAKGSFNGKLFNTFELVNYPIEMSSSLAELLKPSEETRDC